MTIMIATNRPAIAGRRICSDIDGPAVACGGVAVATGWSTTNALPANDPKYASDPAKVTYTVYVPGMSGIQAKLYWPLESVVVVPIVL